MFLLDYALIFTILAVGMASCTAVQVPTNNSAYCEAQPTAILPDGTECADIVGRTAPGG